MTSAGIGEPHTLPTTQLHLFHKNARRGDVDSIAGSLAAHGQFRPIVVNKGTHTGRPNEVLAGNHTLLAIRQLAEQHPENNRWQNVDCWIVDVDDERATRIVLADNRTADLGSYDNDTLLDLLGNLDDDLGLVGTGYDQGYIDALLGTNEWGGDDTEEDWDSAFDNMPGDEPNTYTRTFTLTRDQADLVDATIDTARNRLGPTEGNENGAALAWICERIEA